MVEQVVKQISKMIQTTGRTLLSIKFPNDIESYFVTLELCEGDTDKTINFFTFPINPNAFSKKENSQHNIKKTFGGIVVNDSSDFIPQELTIRGNFGRSLKLLSGDQTVNFFGIGGGGNSQESQEGGSIFSRSVQGIKNLLSIANITKELNQFIKTGYGCTKYLQAICKAAKAELDPLETPRKLYFHNHILGESYFVKVKQLQIEQTMETNMIYNYTLVLDIIAPTFVVRDEQILAKSLQSATLQSAMNETAKLAIKGVRKLINV